MNSFTLSALIAFFIFAMGLAGVMAGIYNYVENRESKSGKNMMFVCICVFFWDFGYALMSLCYNDDFAYIPRAIALLAVTYYIYFILKYASDITYYPKKRLFYFSGAFLLVSIIAWLKIIQKDAVEFTITPWGYWYYSKMSWARILQFACVIAGVIQYYVIMRYGFVHAKNKREKYILKRFLWFGPILFTGYIFDTLIPTIFNTPAIPGSAISAFFSVNILFITSQNNKVFGLSKANVSSYVFDDVKIPILITDAENKIMLFNDFASAYLKCEYDTLMNQSIHNYFIYEANDIYAVKDLDRECKLEKTDVKDQFDDLQYSIYFVRDITEEIRAFRSAEESKQIAEEANRAKSNFLANMSHEIRTPMNAIIGMSEIILQDSSEANEVTSKVQDIRMAGQNLLGIINDILDISKIEAGKYELVCEKYDLASLIHDVSNIIRIRIQENGIEFNLKINPDVPQRLIGDIGRIRQILLNILGNAAKFTKQGSITLVVDWNNNPENAQLKFDVIDTGIGIREEDIDKIFGEFSQVDTRKNRNIQGTGLGLAISKHLAILMGGDVSVESKYGKGSTFHIVVTQKIDKYVALGEKIAEQLVTYKYNNIATKKETVIVKRPDAKILIVDDTPINLRVASGLLKKYGLQIDLATSGAEAIDKVKQKDYDIVFMDHMMPSMDGVEATKHIRNLGGKFNDIVIIALTANALSGAKEMFIQEGMQDFLAKPIDLDELNEIMNKWIPV